MTFSEKRTGKPPRFWF